MPPIDTLPHILDLHVNLDAALRAIQISRQIYVGSWSLMTWAWWFAITSMSFYTFRYFVSNWAAIAGVPLPSGGGGMDDDVDDDDDDDLIAARRRAYQEFHRSFRE